MATSPVKLKTEIYRRFQALAAAERRPTTAVIADALELYESLSQSQREMAALPRPYRIDMSATASPQEQAK